MRMIIVVAVATMVPAFASSAADDKADQRAVDYCKSTSGTFVDVAKCLPSAHVAFKTLDAFETVYPAESQPLREKCIQLNDGDIPGAATCVTEAIAAALDLSASLPAGSKLDDPIFDSVSNANLKAQLDEVKKAARAAFPNVMMWGGSLYKAYQ